jgi:nucleoside-diphosphate-sugar epimerase
MLPDLDSRVLVTGGTGFVGRALVNRLGKESVRLVTRSDFGHLAEVVAGITTLVHLAGRAHVMHETSSDPLAAFRAFNVEATLNLARHAADAGVGRFVFISSVKVNGESTPYGQEFVELDTPHPHDAYGQSKWEAEQALCQLSANTGMEIVIIRPPLVYGFGVKANFALLAMAVNRGWPLPLGAVHNQRSLIALGNLVDFIVVCMTHPQAANQTFLVSDGHDLSTTELVRGMADAAGVPLRLMPVPVWAMQMGASMLGKGDVAQRLFGNLQVNISKARNMLDWVPPVSVSHGLRQAMGVSDL